MAQKIQPKTQNEQRQPLAFTNRNYQLLLISMAIVLVGFLLMIGKTDIYDLRKTLIAPMVVLAGFAFGVYAILKKNA